MQKNVLFLLFALPILASCQSGQIRGLADAAYVSSSRPAITLEAPSLPLQGCEQTIVKLNDAGVLGGLSMTAWITVYGTNPMVVFGHTDLPPGWTWDAGMQQSFAQDTSVCTLGGIPFFAQTLLEHSRNNPFLAAKKDEENTYWLVRNFSARFNANRTKLVLEYREKAPLGLESIETLPYGHADLLKNFAKRALSALTVTQGMRTSEQSRQKLPILRVHLLTERFWGTATANDYWRDK